MNIQYVYMWCSLTAFEIFFVTFRHKCEAALVKLILNVCTEKSMFAFVYSTLFPLRTGCRNKGDIYLVCYVDTPSCDHATGCRSHIKTDRLGCRSDVAHLKLARQWIYTPPPRTCGVRFCFPKITKMQCYPVIIVHKMWWIPILFMCR